MAELFLQTLEVECLIMFKYLEKAYLQGIDSTLIVKTAFSKYNLSLGVGLMKVAGKVFRIGHLGNMDEVMLSSALAGTEMALLNAGVKITPGSGIGAAIQYWSDTSSVIKTRAPPS